MDYNVDPQGEGDIIRETQPAKSLKSIPFINGYWLTHWT